MHVHTPVAATTYHVEVVAHFNPTFQKALDQSLVADQELQKVQSPYLQDIRQFVTALCEKGYAEVTGTDEHCRSICVTAQGAIEDALKELLATGEVSQVEALFITPLPPTPLRKKGCTQGLSAVPFEASRQYTLDKRENTVRALREAGAAIICVYNQDKYDALKQKKDAASVEQVAIYEEEKLCRLVVDHPTTKEIPSDAVGALYMITDREGNRYYLATQGIQAADASDGVATWKKWLVKEDSIEGSGIDRVNQMLGWL